MTDPEKSTESVAGAPIAAGTSAVDPSRPSGADPSGPRAVEATFEPSDDEQRRAREWLANVYVGDRVPQLTLRSVLTGMVLGGVMAVSNLYVGMKTGWSLGVTITASILAHALFSTLQRVVPRLRENEFIILENNMVASVASAAGYMAGSIFVSAVPALYLCSGQTVPGLQLVLWACAVSFLGVFMAIPMKRQQVNIDQLAFPTGLATAETLRAMHDQGGDAGPKALGLTLGALIGALVGWLREAHARSMPLPSLWTPAGATLGGQPLQRLTIGADLSLVMIGAGAIIGIRVGTSLLISAIVCYGVLGPWVIGQDPPWVDPNRYRQTWALWPGVGLLVASGLTMFSMRWRTIVRAFSNLQRVFGSARDASDDPLRDVDAPQSWFVKGSLVSGLACVLLGHCFFGISRAATFSAPIRASS
jgi:putative OPT family oligopeptide transporter